MTYKELKYFYSKYFSVSYFNVDITDRFGLIGLICYLTKELKRKSPDVDYYKVVYKVTENMGFDDDFIKGLAIVCEDFGANCKEYPTYGLKNKEIVPKIKEILNSYLPF